MTDVQIMLRMMVYKNAKAKLDEAEVGLVDALETRHLYTNNNLEAMKRISVSEDLYGMKAWVEHELDVGAN